MDPRSSRGGSLPTRTGLLSGSVRVRRRRAGARNLGDRLFSGGIFALAALIPILLVAIIVLLGIFSWPSIQRYGLSFLTTSEWDPVFEHFGAAAYIYGTLVTSLIALLLATPISVGAALFLVEYAPRALRDPIAFVIELLAAIPSIIYGLWGFFILAPVMRTSIEPLLKGTLGQVPLAGALFSGPAIGKDLLTGGVILAIMIVPIITAVSREVLRAVPDTQREAMLALGATKWEVMRYAVLPYARVGIAGGAILGLARALGETMAVTLVIGNSSTKISASLFTPGYTLASAIANQFTEADKEIYFSAVVEVGLVLLLIAASVNMIARLLIWSIGRGQRAATRAG